ncbi:hypothetical protein COCON_G00130090 [Conger conger]|uniref:GON-4-like protein n=1 Tax=Conger conger TaxID=82655 RepID=A0A9Q1HX67_CONCO|nr:hypothetical protein COCON_G00130090 [Conger conger]
MAAPRLVSCPQSEAPFGSLSNSPCPCRGPQVRPVEAQNGRQEISAGTPARDPPTSPKTDEVEPAEQGARGEQEEEEEEKGEEEQEGGDLGGALLALSESSASPASSAGSLEETEEEEGGGEGWDGLLTSTPQHSPQGKREGEGLGLDDIASEEEEVMSSASERSVLSVPELQETMEKLTLLASEGTVCDDVDSPNSLTAPPSPSSPRNSAEGEGLHAGEGPGEGGASQSAAAGGTLRPRGKGVGKGRGDGRHPRVSVNCSGHRELDGQDVSKQLLVESDEDTTSTDPLRESKDMAFAQAYLHRVCAALRDVPGKVEEFLRVLYVFEQGDGGRSSVELFGQLKRVLKDRPDLLWDFAAFLRPEQAEECGLLAEQQAFERSRHFLRQLEMSFGESPSHYSQVVRALQGGPGLSPAGLRELKAEIASLLKHHAHLQGEFWEFFDELHAHSTLAVRPGDTPPSEVGEGPTEGQERRGGARRPLRREKLPVSQEGEEPRKAGPMRARRKKKGSLGSNTHKATRRCGLSAPESSTPPPAGDPQKAQEEREDERREGETVEEERGEGAPAEASEEEEEEECEEGDVRPESSEVGEVGDAPSDAPAAHQTPLSPDPPVCAKNVSLTSTGQRVILWTREADRIILTTCQKKGANRSTFQAVSAQLGNKTANEVSLRFQELMDLFHRAARPDNAAGDTDQQSGSDDDPD